MSCGSPGEQETNKKSFPFGTGFPGNSSTYPKPSRYPYLEACFLSRQEALALRSLRRKITLLLRRTDEAPYSLTAVEPLAYLETCIWLGKSYCTQGEGTMGLIKAL